MPNVSSLERKKLKNLKQVKKLQILDKNLFIWLKTILIINNLIYQLGRYEPSSLVTKDLRDDSAGAV